MAFLLLLCNHDDDDKVFSTRGFGSRLDPAAVQAAFHRKSAPRPADILERIYTTAVLGEAATSMLIVDAVIVGFKKLSLQTDEQGLVDAKELC